ncbi:MAG: YcxB family protein [bacterium]|nr:YcxB family protein [bacterium]
MEVEFDITITCGSLYDYLLHYTYTSLQGLIGAAAGALFLVEFFFSRQILFLICGLLVLCYLPVSLYLRAKQQSLNPVFKKPIHYRMTDEGVEISQGGESQTHGWDVFYKAGATMGSLLLYTTKRNATIFPKRQLQKQDVQGKVMEMISTHMPPKKVNIR